MSLKSVEFFLKIVSLSKSLFQKKIFPSICTWVERFHLNVSPRLAFHLFAYENAVRKELKQLIMKCDCKILRRSSTLWLTAKITFIPRWYSGPVTHGVPSVITSLAICCCYLHLQPLTRSSPATCASKGINGSGAGACLWPHPVCAMEGRGEHNYPVSMLSSSIASWNGEKRMEGRGILSVASCTSVFCVWGPLLQILPVCLH